MAEKSGFEALKTGSALLKKGTFAEKVEQRAVIKFCVDIGKTSTDTHTAISKL
jgi:predicted nucleic acid-binding Zn finger protein